MGGVKIAIFNTSEMGSYFGLVAVHFTGSGLKATDTIGPLIR